MTRRIVTVVIILFILFGLVFGFHFFRQFMIKKYIHQMLTQVVTISTAKAEKQSWIPAIDTVGTLSAVNGVEVNSQVPGQVVNIFFHSGQQVATGDNLVQLDDSLDRESLKMQQAQYNLNSQDYKRKQELAAKKVISQDELDRSRTQMLQSESSVATAKINIEKKLIKAPFAGRLGISEVNLGQYVSPGQPLVSLQQMDPLFVDFSLPEQQLNQVSVGQKVNLSVDAFPNQAFAGQITAINSKADVATHMISIRATIPNNNNQLYPGLFADVKVLLSQPVNVVAVPQTAVTYSLHGDSVYVIENKGKDAQGNPIYIANQRFVTVGERRDNVVAITSGVQPGEEVVSSGQLKLQPGMRVNINNAVPVG